jgi:hypothetical protein
MTDRLRPKISFIIPALNAGGMGSAGLKIQARLIERLEKHHSQATTKRTEAARPRSQAGADFLGTVFS